MGTSKVNRGKVLHKKTQAKEIASLKQEIKALRESEEHFRSVLETVTEAIITIDENTNVISWNPAAEEMFGFTGFRAIQK